MKILTPDGRPDRVAIVKPSASDLQVLLELDRLCFGARAWPARAWWEVLHVPGWTSRVLRLEGKVVGATVLLLDRQVTSLASIAVHPAWHRRGLGSMLLEDTIAIARKAGAAWLSLHVDQGHAGAMGLYRRHGFVTTVRYVEESIPRLEMLRRLSRRAGSRRGWPHSGPALL